MANARIATGAILSTVTDTAQAVSSVVNTISGGLGMANAFVQHQQAKQRITQADDLIDFETESLENIALRIAERKKKISDLCKDPELKTYYNEAYASIEQARAARNAA